MHVAWFIESYCLLAALEIPLYDHVRVLV